VRRVRRKALCALALLALFALHGAATLRAAERPSFTVSRDGALTVSGLPDILSRPEVRPHLSTGLTTTFALRVTATDETGKKVKGGGRIDVRWEPWDEVFLTAAIGVDGHARHESVPSLDRLAAWWHGLEVLTAAGLAPGGRWDVRVEVSVIPFSASEQRNTQRWFSDSLGQKPGPAPGTSPGADQGAAVQQANPNGVLDLLIATSIKRRTLAQYVWTAAARPNIEHRKGGAA
jgi:hypothetical protein